MDYSPAVGLGQPVADLDGQLQGLFHRQAAILEVSFQGPAFHEFHDDVGLILEFVDAVNGHDMGMVKLGRGLGFFPEHFSPLGILAQVTGQKFQGHFAVQVSIIGQVDSGKSSQAENFLNGSA